MQTVLKYPGSKWRIAPWIIKHIPSHHTYLEPFFGSGAILFNKPISNIEMVNDLDDQIVNLFRCIKEDAEKLAAITQFTPYSRKEYEDSFKGPIPTDKYEKAAMFLVQCWQGHGFRSNGRKVGWKNDVQGREDMYAVKNWYRLPEWIIQITERLKQVQIDNRPAIELIDRFRYPNVFIYADPPYLPETRSGKQYKHEMDQEDHINLLESLLKHTGPVIISGYHSKLYDELLKGWIKAETSGESEYYGRRKKPEVIWMNYKPSVEQLSMF